MPTPRETAEAFSTHRFGDAYPVLAADVRWTSVGQGTLTGREAVVDACEDTLAHLATTEVEFLHRLVVAEGDAAAVDTVSRYVDADGQVSVVSSCDVYQFRAGTLVAITSYTVELPDPTDG